MSSGAVVAQNVVGLYAGPDTASEMVSQAVLGDAVVILEERGEWVRVSTADRYEGWLKRSLLVPPPDSSGSRTTIATLFADVFSAPDPRTEILTKLVVGTSVALAHRPDVGEWTALALPDGDLGWVHRVGLNSTHGGAAGRLRLAQDSGIGRAAVFSAIGRQATAGAQRLVGTPYLWGGCTPFGLDCSGLTQLAYKLNGVQLLRDAQLQFGDRRFVRVEEGQSLDTALLEPGDLLAFSRREDGRPTHIGLALGDGRFVHARGGRGVRVDFCDEGEYGETYRGAVRLSADADLAIQSA